MFLFPVNPHFILLALRVVALFWTYFLSRTVFITHSMISSIQHSINSVRCESDLDLTLKIQTLRKTVLLIEILYIFISAPWYKAKCKYIFKYIKIYSLGKENIFFWVLISSIREFSKLRPRITSLGPFLSFFLERNASMYLRN